MSEPIHLVVTLQVKPGHLDRLKQATAELVAASRQEAGCVSYGAAYAEDGVTAYEGVLAQYAPKGFDLHLLGMGHEGHMNSLFPHTDAVRETERLVLAVTDSPKPPAERGTLTLPAVAQADHVWLLIDGAAKAEAAAHVIAESPAEDWPAAGAHGRKETLVFLADEAARAGA